MSYLSRVYKDFATFKLCQQEGHKERLHFRYREMPAVKSDQEMSISQSGGREGAVPRMCAQAGVFMFIQEIV